MVEKEKQAFQLTFNGFLKVDFQGSRVTSDGGLILGPRVGRTTRARQADQRTSQRFPAGVEQAVHFRRSAAPVGLQSPGGLGGPQRRRARIG